ncbi:glycosyltransferase [Synechococcales cyanobacterium C]|uniref:Glycosyltransferase n=1 Tax=Petrachloros mirabilis ULC683 TaxID=2781853 RepID=A0A8K1ZY52_9CYAN|nr:glycosyltransferase [Petrachloros mirabilis]NCJ06253.1 glycosyltransferase [Petrachloros mirabilis ULC683]
MRIAYILKRYPRFSETFVVSEILAHETAGLDIIIFALHPPVDAHFQDIIARVRAPVSYLPSRHLRGSQLWQTFQDAANLLPDFWSKLPISQSEDVQDVYQAIILAHEAVRRGITHFHAHFGTSATTVARLASHFSGIPYTFTAHAKDIFHESVQPDDLRRKLNDAAAVITVSNYNLAYLQHQYGAAAAHGRRIYNGLDLSQFHYSSPQDRPNRIVGVGRLVEKKGFADLISACEILAQTHQNFHCQIVGHGELAPVLQHQIDRVGLQRWVELVGPKPQEEIKSIVQEAAVLVAPCVVGTDRNQDGLPTVLLEAMALGTPCISTDVAGIPEVVRHGMTGIQVPQHNPVALAAALSQMLEDVALRVELATAARCLIESSFNVHDNTAEMRQLFQRQPVLATTSGVTQSVSVLEEVN